MKKIQINYLLEIQTEVGVYYIGSSAQNIVYVSRGAEKWWEIFIEKQFYSYFAFQSVQWIMDLGDSKREPINQKIDEIAKDGFEFYIKNIQLETANFPLMGLTFSLWRKHAYEKMRSYVSSINEENSVKNDYHFFKNSELKYLLDYKEKINEQMNVFARGMKDIKDKFTGIQKLEKSEEEVYQKIVELGEKVWEQQLYLELIEDLIRLPYLQVIPAKSNLFVRPTYATGYLNQKTKPKPKLINKIADKVGQTCFNKTLNSATELIFSKAFVYQINTLIGTFNPILMGASFGLSHYMKKLDESKKSEQLKFEIISVTESVSEKVDLLKGTYYQCLNQIDRILGEQVSSNQQMVQLKEELKKNFLTVYEQEWLQIEVIKEEDGWEIVNLHEKQSFQELS